MTPTTAGNREKCELIMAITGAHTLFYTSEIDAFRAVMRDALKLPIVAEDGGFMIFGLPETTMEPHAGPPELDIHPGDRATHEVSFMCGRPRSDDRGIAGQGSRIPGRTA